MDSSATRYLGTDNGSSFEVELHSIPLLWTQLTHRIYTYPTIHLSFSSRLPACLALSSLGDRAQLESPFVSSLEL